MKRMMIVSAVCVLLAAGCDYTVPLVKTPNLPVDSAVVGLWRRTAGDNTGERLLVLPLSKQEYLVVFPAGTKDAMFARGCLWRDGDTPVVQLDWFGTGRGSLPDDHRTFQYATYALDQDTLSIRLLNPDVVAADITASDALADAVTDHKNHPDLFREKMVFEKIKH